MAVTYTVQTSPFPTLTFGTRIVHSDFDGDGDLDILYQDGNTAGTGIALRLNNGNGTFSSAIAKPDGAASPFTSGPLSGLNFTQITQTTVYVVDLNGDGRDDIVDVQGASSTPLFYRNTGSGFVQETSPLPAQPFSGRVVFGDFNGDGYVDILNQAGNTASTGITLYLNNGTGGFSFTSVAKPDGSAFTSGPLAGLNFSQVTSTAVTAIDLTGDGRVDLVDAQASSTPLFYRNTGSGFVQETSPLPTQPFSGRIVYGDFNGDGYVDILNQAGNTASTGITLYLNNGTGGFSFTSIAKPDGSAFTSGPLAGVEFSSVQPTTLFVRDWDRDSDLDILNSQNGSSSYVQQSTKPPLLVSSTPADNSTTFSSTANIVLVFDEAVTTGSGNIVIRRSSDGAVVETIAANGARVTGSGTTTITIDPVNPLAQGTGYYLTVDIGAFLDADGVGFGVSSGSTRTSFNGTTALNFTTATNAVPTLTNLSGDSFTYVEGSGAVAIDRGTAAVVSDPDSTGWAGGRVTVSVAGGVAASETLSVASGTGAGSISVVGSAVHYDSGTGPIQIGTIDAASTGQGTGLVVNLAAAATDAALSALVAALRYANGSEAPVGSRTIQVSVADATLGTSTVASVTANLQGVNDAPVLTAPASASAAEDATLTITSISVADVDAQSGSMTVTLSALNGVISLVNATGVTVANGGTKSVTITGARADINTALAAGVNYTGDTNFRGSDTLTVTVDDGGASGVPLTPLTDQKQIAITVTPVNDAPVVSSALASAGTFVENGATVALLADGAVADPDSPANFAGGSLRVQVTNGAAAGDAITLLASSGFTVQGTDLVSGGVTVGTVSGLGSADVLVSFNASVDATTATALLRAFGYANTGEDPGSATRQVTFTFNDGGNTGSGGALTGAFVQSVNVTPVNDAPTVVAGPNIVVAEDAGPQTFTNWATGIGTGGEASQLLTMTTSVVAGTGTLAFISPPAVNVSTGTLTFTTAPNTFGTATVQVRISDTGGTLNGGQDQSEIREFTITVNPANDAPVNTVPGPQTASEDLPLTISGLSVADVDAGTGILVTTLSVTNGRLTVTGGDTGVVQGSGGATVTLTGTLAQINAVLQGAGNVSYQGNLNFNGSDTLTVTTNDGGATGSGSAGVDTKTVAITVNPVNDDPTISGVSYFFVTNENVPVKPFENVTFADVDAGDVLEVRVLADWPPRKGDILLNGAAGTINAAGDYRIVGTAAEVTAAVRALSFDPYDNRVATGQSESTFLSLQVGDGTVTRTAGAAVEIRSTAVNDAPVNTVPAAQSATEDTNLVIAGLQVADPDSATVTTQLQVNRGTLTVLGDPAVVSGSGTSTVTLTGSVAQVNAVLQAANAVTYRGNPDANGSDTLTVTTNDGAVQSVSTVAITVAAVNDAPVFTPGGNVQVDEDAGAYSAVWATGIGPGGGADEAGQGLRFEVSLSNPGLFQSGVTLLPNGTLSFTPAANASGTSTVSFILKDDNGTPLDTSDDGENSGSFTITVGAVNDAPTVGAPSTLAGTEDTPLTISGLTFGDVDAGSATVTATFSVPSGTLAATGVGPVSASGSGTGTLQLLGTAADIQAYVAGGGVTFTPVPNASGRVDLSITLDDGGATGSGGAKLGTATVGLVLAATADAPVIAGTTAGAPAGASTLFRPFSGVTVTDVDLPAQTFTATVTMDAAAKGSFAELGAGSYVQATGVYTVTGTAAEVTAALQGLRFVPRIRTDALGTPETTEFTIRVVDPQLGQVTDTGSKVTALTDNLAPTNITLSSSSIAEGAAGGTAVGTLASVDRPGDTHTYTLVDGAGGRFTLQGSTLVVANGAAIDREAAASHTVVVRSTDQGGLFLDRSFVVAVTDVNEFAVTAPTDVDAAPNRVAERSAVGTVVGITARATDGDATGNGVAYSLVGGTGEFAVDAGSGVVRVAGPIDWDLGTSRTVTIRATSQDGSTATSSFTVAVEPVGVIGTSGSEVVTGTASGERVLGLGGNDTVFGGLGRDTIEGGPGSDGLTGSGVGSSFSFESTGSWTGAGNGTQGWTLGDYDGDGRTDLLRYQPGVSGAEVFLSNGTSFQAAGSWTGAGNGTQGWYAGDFNGDRKTDLFRYQPGASGAEVFLSTGTSFAHAGSWTGAGNDGTWTLGDFDGDGRTDILRYAQGVSGAEVFLSNGTSFQAAGSWTGAGNGTQGWYAGDFNGDGRSDLLRYQPGVSGAEVFLSTGSGFTSAGSWTLAGNNGRWTLGDYDGDGRTDLLRHNPGVSGAELFLSTGSSFQAAGSWTGAGDGAQGWYAGNFDGRGGTDILRYSPGVSGAEVFLSRAAPDGRDTFVFKPGFGHDVINDLDILSADGDVIQFDRSIFASADAVLAASAQVGNDVLITASATDSVLLKNVLLGNLNASDFSFL